MFRWRSSRRRMVGDGVNGRLESRCEVSMRGRDAYARGDLSLGGSGGSASGGSGRPPKAPRTAGLAFPLPLLEGSQPHSRTHFYFLQLIPPTHTHRSSLLPLIAPLLSPSPCCKRTAASTMQWPK